MIASTFAIIIALAVLCISSPHPTPSAPNTPHTLLPWDPAPASSFIAIPSPINEQAEAIMADKLPGVFSSCCLALRACFAEAVNNMGLEGYSDFDCLAHAAKTCGPIDRAAEMRLCMQPVLPQLRDYGARAVGELRIVPVPPVKSEEDEEDRRVDVVVVTLTVTNMVTETIAPTMDCTISTPSETSSTPTPTWTPTVTPAPPSETSDLQDEGESCWQRPGAEAQVGSDAWGEGAWGEGREWKGRRRSVGMAAGCGQ